MYFGQNLQIIEDDAFSYCSSLTQLFFPDSLNVIFDSFKHCKKLSCINIPKNLKFIGNYAFIDSSINKIENEKYAAQKFKGPLRSYFI